MDTHILKQLAQGILLSPRKVSFLDITNNGKNIMYVYYKNEFAITQKSSKNKTKK